VVPREELCFSRLKDKSLGREFFIPQRSKENPTATKLHQNLQLSHLKNNTLVITSNAEQSRPENTNNTTADK